MVELSSGIDAFYLSGWARLDNALTKQLDESRRLAAANLCPQPFNLGERTMLLMGHAWGRYRWCLRDQHGQIGFTDSRHLPQVRIQPYAPLLHSVGPAGAVDHYAELLADECDDLQFRVNRVDLYADFQGWDLSAADRHRFCCRADELRTHETTHGFSGYAFDSRSSHTISARIYDKTQQIQAKGTEWWKDIWSSDYRPGETVWRVEFEFGRQILNEFRLDSPAEVVAGAGDLWRYATTDWLTHRVPSETDGTKSRWQISPQWRAVQQAALADKTLDIQRIRHRQTAASIRNLLPAITGYLASFGALSHTIDVDDTLEALHHHLREYEIISRTLFPVRVERRRLKMGLPQ